MSYTFVTYFLYVLQAYYAHYDFGQLSNLNHYGQDRPPLYDATKVFAPVFAFWGDKDWLADPVVSITLDSKQ